MRFTCQTSLFLVLLLVSYLPLLHAGGLININGMYYESSGKYYIVEDENGVCLRTDQGASWYLSTDEQKAFRSGDEGLYYLEKEVDRPYILTDKKHKFYFKQKLPKKTQEKNNYSSNYSEPIMVIRDSRAMFRSINGEIYATKAEALMGRKGQATIDWERKKAEEEARLRAEEEARRRAEEEERKKMIQMEILWRVEEARREAEKAHREAEAARKIVEEKTYMGPAVILLPHVIDRQSGTVFTPAAGGVVDPRTGVFYQDVGGGYINSQTGQFHPK